MGPGFVQDFSSLGDALTGKDRSFGRNGATTFSEQIANSKSLPAGPNVVERGFILKILDQIIDDCYGILKSRLLIC